MKLINNAAKLQTAIESIARRNKRWRVDVHIAAVSCLDQAATHGNTNLFFALLDAVGKTYAKRIESWALEFGPFYTHKTTGELKLAKPAKGGSRKWNQDGAIECHPFDYKAESKPAAEYTEERFIADIGRILEKAASAKLDTSLLARVAQTVGYSMQERDEENRIVTEKMKERAKAKAAKEAANAEKAAVKAAVAASKATKAKTAQRKAA